MLAIFSLLVLLTTDYLLFCGISGLWDAHAQQRDAPPAHGLNVKDISIDRELVAGPWQAVGHIDHEAGDRLVLVLSLMGQPSSMASSTEKRPSTSSVDRKSVV